MAQQYAYPRDLDDVELHPGFEGLSQGPQQYADARAPPRKDSVAATVTEKPKSGKALPPVPAAQARADSGKYIGWQQTERQEQGRYYRNDEQDAWYDGDREDINYQRRQSCPRQQFRQAESYDDRKNRERAEERQRITQDYNGGSYDPRGSQRNSNLFDSPYTTPAGSISRQRRSYIPEPPTSDFGRYPSIAPSNDGRYPSMRRTTQQSPQRRPQRRPSTSSDSYTSDD